MDRIIFIYFSNFNNEYTFKITKIQIILLNWVYMESKSTETIQTKSKQFVIITTINDYTKTSIPDYLKFDSDIVVVGDKKTPHETYDKSKIKNDKVQYLHPESEIFSKFSELLPYNHYCRKNIGYLWAIHEKADSIFDTDDDNYPLGNFDSWRTVIENSKTITSPKMPNIMSLFTDLDIWARGFPLELIQKRESVELDESTTLEREKIGVIQSLATGDPDVDAIYRLTNKNYSSDIVFDENKSFICKKNIFTQGNTQATIWTDKKLFHLLYIPCTVSFRFCDILKMYVAQKCMWEYNKLFCYISPIVNQDRNDHDFVKDLVSEYSMYSSVFKIINTIFDELKLSGEPSDLLLVYTKLFENDIVKLLELELVKQWLKCC